MNVALPVFVPAFLKAFHRIFIFCFLTPGKTWQQEFVIKYCAFFVARGVLYCISVFSGVAGYIWYSSSEEKNVIFFVSEFVNPFVFGAFSENVLLMLICRIAVRFHISDFWTVFFLGLLFGGLHIFVNDDISYVNAIFYFWIMTGMYLNWHRSKNAFLIILLFHGLWNFNATILFLIFGKFFEYWLG
ncbi:hypothetical protein [Undibacterium squillarum]|uniref:hypothetical protein n=1 Tax=Undibacterium squillarum TaxID=1131567 RepID=UPI001672FF45|nr:hypothetical protein [Undibacterium squillarum]